MSTTARYDLGPQTHPRYIVALHHPLKAFDRIQPGHIATSHLLRILAVSWYVGTFRLTVVIHSAENVRCWSASPRIVQKVRTPAVQSVYSV